MKPTLLLLVFCASFLTCSTQNSTWIGLEKANRTNIKRYEKHCLERTFAIGPMDKGEVKRIQGICAQATCLEDRNVKFSGCPFVGLSDRVKCRIHKGDLTKEYPECCYELRCNEDNNNSTGEIYQGYVNVTKVDLARKEKKKDE